MATNTGIAWTDSTWNPLRGCSRVSEGCRNCYAEIQAARANGPGQPYEGLVEMKDDGPHWTGKMMVVEKHMLDPRRWEKPRRIFVNSMSDLFHENVSDETIARIFAVMAMSPRHTFQVLTKRAGRMMQWTVNPANRLMVSQWIKGNGRQRVTDAAVGPYAEWPLPNVWLGISVEDQKAADERIPKLLEAKAAIRFISAEPLLGPVDLKPTWIRPGRGHGGEHRGNGSPECPRELHHHCDEFCSTEVLDWVIVGGESGENFRPMQKEWAEALRHQCGLNSVDFFFKQDSDEKPGQRADLLGQVIQQMPKLVEYDLSDAQKPKKPKIELI